MEISIKRTPKNSKNSTDITTQELLDFINATSFMSEALDERVTLIGRIFEDEISKVNTKIDKIAELLADTIMAPEQKRKIEKEIDSINEDLDYMSKEFTKKPLEQDFKSKISDLRKKYNIKEEE